MKTMVIWMEARMEMAEITREIRQGISSKSLTFGVCLLMSMGSWARGAENIADKESWVSRAASGGFVGVWTERRVEELRATRFSIGTDGMVAIVTRRREDGTGISTLFAYVPAAPTRAGKGKVLGFVTAAGSLGPEPGKAIEDLLPSRLPKGMEEKLRRLGADEHAMKRMKYFMEGTTALERFYAPGVLAENPIKDSRRPAGPPGTLPESPGAKHRRGGEASSDGKPPSEGAEGLGNPATDEQRREAAQEDAGRVERAESERTPEGGERQTRRSSTQPRGEAVQQAHTLESPQGGNGDSTYKVITTFSDGHVTELTVGRVSEANREAVTTAIFRRDYRTLNRLVEHTPESGRVVTRGGIGPDRSPDEGGRIGGLGVDPGAWGFLRGTGLATHLWNRWQAQAKRDFGMTVRQPGRGDAFKPGASSVAPKVGPESVTNPSGPIRGSRTPPEIPTLGDPVRDPDGGGGSPRPGPRPKR